MIDNTTFYIIDRGFNLLPLIFSTYYIYFLTLKSKITTSHKVLIILSAASIIFVTISFELILSIYLKIIFISLICLSLYLLSIKLRNINFPLMIISYGCSFCFQNISGIITGILFYFFKYNEVNIVTTLFVAVTTVFLTLIFMRIKRFSKGFNFLLDKNNSGIGLLISGFIIAFCCISGYNFVDNYLFTIVIISVLISSIGLFLWIRKSITEHYRKKLQDKADKHYQAVLAEKEEYIEQLNSSIAYLSKVVHRDNHLMSSLQYSIGQFKNCDNGTEKQKILDEILTLTNERRDLLIKEQKSNKLLASTGSAIIDGALANLYVKASAHNIDFNLIVNDEVHYLINNIITQTDLETLLCDHIKDAVIAIESVENIDGKILVKIGMVNNVYEISIKDNGIDFDINTLSKLGLERVTTHKETGGSGIGFMTTFETLAKTKGSLIISEFENNIPFSKSITFRFDGLNDFIIKSYRSNEIKEIINRGDVTVI